MKKEEEETRGRKPSEDPKQTIYLGVKQSIIKKIGGVDKTKLLIGKMLEAYVTSN